MMSCVLSATTTNTNAHTMLPITHKTYSINTACLGKNIKS